MDIRWTYADTGARAIPAVVARMQWGRHRLEVRTGSWCRFDQQHTNHPHRHDGFYECWLVTAGSGVFVHGDQRYPLQAGVLNVADPGTVHEILSHIGDLILVYWAIRIESVSGVGESYEAQLVQRFLEDHAAHLEQQHHLFPNFVSVAESAGPTPQWRQQHFMQLIALETMAALARHPPSEPSISESDDVIQRALGFITAHIHRPIAAREVAAAVRLSERQLRRVFQKYFHSGIAEVISERRFNRAAQNLLLGKNAKETASMLGIADPSQFGRQFKKHFGMTPRQYQQHYLHERSLPRTTHTPSKLLREGDEHKAGGRH